MSGSTSADITLIALRCPSCGGGLETTRDVDLFKCKYCGELALVRRNLRAGHQEIEHESVKLVLEFERPANLWRGRFLWVFPNAQGGRLGLTDREVVFVPHRFNAGPLTKCSLPIADVGVKAAGMDLVFTRADGTVMEFVVSDPGSFAAEVESRRRRLLSISL